MLVGEDPASQVYVRNKNRQTFEAGMLSLGETLPEDTTQADLLAVIDKLNANPAVNGILVQLPLPSQIDPNSVIDAIDPAKDVDGFQLRNVGLLATGRDGMVTLHATGLPNAAGRPARRSDRPERGYRRALQHRWQTHGATAAGRELHGDGCPFAHRRFTECLPPKQTFSSPRSAGRR